MSSIPDSLRRQVVADAKNRCGYCQTAQRISGAQLQIDHIIPLARGGTSDESNLWLACAWCNSYKASQTHAIDPETNEWVALFNPRAQNWHEHFAWSDDKTEILGITPIGRATVIALRMNNAYIVPARRYWALAGWHPPQD